MKRKRRLPKRRLPKRRLPKRRLPKRRLPKRRLPKRKKRAAKKRAANFSPIPVDIYSRPWWFYENYYTTPEQAKARWMKEYNEGTMPIFWQYYERALKGGAL